MDAKRFMMFYKIKFLDLVSRRVIVLFAILLIMTQLKIVHTHTKEYQCYFNANNTTNAFILAMGNGTL